ncbi:MEDS domain-containing protein [Clostridium ganghwense]|uniref:MEDS domain-containing protein n=1 Tax=Clostridium ganghwense TaxID=312089 RepID=A0ABT4CRV3_9CLOT|nr:MEDS domain-containing protein [Clostridium ganghwense]MCY6371798.1 MEDS domain-containing protein [Clostridium ganghwense]
MKFSCNHCELYDNIEKYRIELNDLIVKKNHKLLDQEIINLSQSLDDLVYKCVFCNKNLNDFSKLNLKNIFGTHSTFYYYGDQHLFASMYFYITEGINNNELIYISMQESLYNKLIAFLTINDVLVEYIKFRPVKELIMSNRHGGLTQLKEKINNICLENEVKRYSGIRWIGQPTYAIQTTSQKDFLDWETNLSEALKNTNTSLICIYDAYDYIHKSEFINETVIKKSLDTHSHILKHSVLKEIN